jgi:lysophospholipid acyltransferase (LPLAT)-like uncharacterized protein
VSLRKKIANSENYARIVTGVVAGYLRFAHRTSRWQRLGFESMDEAVKSGDPIIMVLWHQRLMMSPYMFDVSLGKFCPLTSSARAGSMVGKLLRRFGFNNVSMSSRKRHVGLSREVLKRIRDGYSIGIATDGPRGPARQSSNVPLVWARVTGKRVFVVSYSSRCAFELPTWDRTMIPTPFTRGVFMCQEWVQTVPRNGADAEYEALRLDLQAALDEVTDASDRASGRDEKLSLAPRSAPNLLGSKTGPSSVGIKGIYENRKHSCGVAKKSGDVSCYTPKH